MRLDQGGARAGHGAHLARHGDRLAQLGRGAQVTIVHLLCHRLATAHALRTLACQHVLSTLPAQVGDWREAEHSASLVG